MNRIIVLIIITSTLIIHACNIEPEPEEPSIRFTIDNASSFNVQIMIFNAGISGKSYGEDVIINILSMEGYSYFYLSSDKHLLIEPADSSFIKFNDEKILTYLKQDNQSRNILDTSFWQYNYASGTGHIYRYTITNEDYENAILIE